MLYYACRVTDHVSYTWPTHPNCSMIETPDFKPTSEGKKGSRTRVFFIIAGIIILSILTFFSLVTYYIWQLKHGDAAALEQSFQGNISLVEGLLTSDETVNQDMVKGMIRSHNPVAGNNNSTITVVAFIDFECPFCQAGYGMFKGVMDTYGPAVKFVFKHFPIESIHPNSTQAALAAQCAHEQKSFWPYYDQLFTNKQLDRELLLGYARATSLNRTAFETCLSNQKYLREVEEDLNDGIALGVRGTPTYFVNGTKIEGVAKREIWDKVILEYLKK